MHCSVGEASCVVGVDCSSYFDVYLVSPVALIRLNLETILPA